MGTRYHSVGKGNGRPRTLEGELRQLEKMKKRLEPEMELHEYRNDPKAVWKSSFLSRENLKSEIEAKRKAIASKMKKHD